MKRRVVSGAARRRLVGLSGDGRLTAREVVDDATPSTSPLHPLFPWDDAEAADKHRLDIARSLIRSVVVTTQDSAGVAHVVPVYVRDPDAAHRDQGYVAVTMLTRKGQKKRVLVAAATTAAAHLDRVEALAVGLGCEDQVAPVLAMFGVFRDGLGDG